MWREIDNATLYFLISSKNLKWKQRFHTDTFWNYLLLNMVGLNIKEGTRQRQGTLMSNHCLISHCWYDVEKLTVPGSISLKAQHKVFVKEMKGKSVTFCFLKLKVKEIENISKIIGEGLLFRGEFRSLFSKLMFTHSAYCWSRSHGVVET